LYRYFLDACAIPTDNNADDVEGFFWDWIFMEFQGSQIFRNCRDFPGISLVVNHLFSVIFFIFPYFPVIFLIFLIEGSSDLNKSGS